MLALGDRIPDASVMLENREPATLRKLFADGPVLLVFYLFDWSST